MARFDRNTVARMAKLAHLSLSEEESVRFPEQLEKIVSFAERLRALDTENVAPSSHALLEVGGSASGALRRDEPRTADAISRESLLEAAPDGDPSSGLFKVPKVLP